MVKRAVGGRGETLRQALIDAAEAVVLADGIQALRARAVAERAGVALGTIYTAFADLDALILALKLRILDRLDAHLQAVIRDRPAGDPDSGLRLLLAMAAAYLAFAWDDRRRWQALFHEHLAEGTAIPDWYRDRLSEIFSRIDAPLRALLPALSGAAAQRLAHTLFSSVHGIVVLGIGQKFGQTSQGEIGAEIEMLVRCAVAGVVARPDLAVDVGASHSA